MDSSLQMKAEGKLLKKPLRTKGESPAQLVNKIVAYNIDKVITFDIPSKKVKATPEQKQEKKQKDKEAKKKKDAQNKLLSPIRGTIGKIFIKYRNMIRKNNFKDDVRDIKKRFRNDCDEAVETFESKQPDEDYELPEEDFDLLEDEIESLSKQLINILDKGSKGDFTDEAKLKRINDERAKRGDPPLKELPKSKKPNK